jgi:hypothetical protein
MRTPLWFIEGMANLLGERSLSRPGQTERSFVTSLARAVVGRLLHAVRTDPRAHRDDPAGLGR